MNDNVERKNLYDKILNDLVLMSDNLHDHLIDLHGSKGIVDDLIELFQFIFNQNLKKEKFTDFLFELNHHYIRTKEMSRDERLKMLRICFEEMIRNVDLCENIFQILKGKTHQFLAKDQIEINLKSLEQDDELIVRILNQLNDELYLDTNKLDNKHSLIDQSDEQIETEMSNRINFEKLDLKKIDSIVENKIFFLSITSFILIAFYLFVKQILFFFSIYSLHKLL